MIAKAALSTSLATALALLPAQKASADAAEFIGGAIIGGIIGHAVTQQNQRSRPATRTVRPGIPATQQGRETQAALNYFGYDAGTVDGQVGPATRAAIERYQASMGYPVNGREFPTYQFDFLMDAYYWATQQGGAMQTGLRGQQLLAAYRNARQPAPMMPAAPLPPASTVIVDPGAQPGTQPVPQQPPASTVVAAPQAEAPPAAATASVPTFFAQRPAPTPSLANACNAVLLQASSNGGYVTLATMTDPGAALSEQFCVARTYAMAEGERLMGQVAGYTPAEIAEQCGGFSAMLAGQVTALGAGDMASVTTAMRAVADGTGLAPADLAATSRVCLGVGYTQDDIRMALGSALMLVSLGEAPYAELLGHHLREGYGVPATPDRAMQWYDAALRALEDGAAPVFMPGQPERASLLRAATVQLKGTASEGLRPVPASQEGATLPVFSIGD